MKRSEDRLADFTQDRRIVILSSMAVAIGIMSAFVAYGLVWLINLFTNVAFYQRITGVFMSPADHHLGLLVILVPVVGGLIVGLLARFGSEKIRGHGIPEALEAILYGRSRMGPKVAVLKPLSSAISIGTGGPFGAEGPIIMTGGAFGSLFAQLFHVSSAERRTLLVAGAAGGMSAIFATPVAAVLLSVELLLFEWKPRSFIPVAIASVVAGLLRVPLMGPGPIFSVVPHDPLGWGGMMTVLGVGIVAGLASALLTSMVYGFEDLFARLPVHWMWWPVLGGLVVGIGGVIDPRVFGVGYDIIHSMLRGEVLGQALLGLLIVKAVVWSVALGSGTSGGVLAPLLIIGGALGAIEAQWIPLGDAGLWAMISMAAMMGGTMRSPLTAITFTLELTHDMNLLPALLLGCIAAHTLTVLMLRRSILTEKVARRGYHVNREYSVDPFEVVRVEEVMDTNVQTVPSTMKVNELSDRIANRDPSVTRHNALSIVDQHGRLIGIITRGDLLRAVESNADADVIDAGSRELILAYPDEVLSSAVARMVANNIGRLPVVSREDPHRLLGYLGRPAILSARLQRLHEESIREHGWSWYPFRRRRERTHAASSPEPRGNGTQ